MPYVKCSRCHHEWETSDCQSVCDWCGAPAGRILEERTPLEKCFYEWAQTETATSTVTVDGVYHDTKRALDGDKGGDQ